MQLPRMHSSLRRERIERESSRALVRKAVLAHACWQRAGREGGVERRAMMFQMTRRGSS